MAAFPCKPQAWLTQNLGISTLQESPCLTQTFDSHLTLAMLCPHVNGLIQLCGPCIMFFNQSGSDVTSSPFLTTFLKSSTFIHTQYTHSHFHTHPVLRRKKTEFSYIIYRVCAKPSTFDLARKRNLINKKRGSLLFSSLFRKISIKIFQYFKNSDLRSLKLSCVSRKKVKYSWYCKYLF